MKTIVYVGTSLDGFIARDDGDIGWLGQYESQEVFRGFAEFMDTIDAVVMGRRTFEKVLAYPSWPYRKKVFVLSRTMTQIPENLRSKAAVVSMLPGELLTYLASQGFSNVYVDGGKVIQSFLREDRIDRLIVTRIPLVIGRGIPLFGGLDHDLRFAHLKTEVFANGLVQSRYERIRD
jgi:dihydrofolate reductase